MRAKKVIKTFISVCLALIMVLGFVAPQFTEVAYAGELAKGLTYEHSSGPKWITENDGYKHWVYCINPNSEAQSGKTPGVSNIRDKYTGDMLYGPLKWNTQGGGDRMTGTQEDQDLLATIVVYGEEKGYSYDEIQAAVKDAVLNRSSKTRGGNALYNYAVNNTLRSMDYELYIYVQPENAQDYQSLVWAKRVPKKVTDTQAQTDKSGAKRASDGAIEIVLPEGETTTGLGTVWDVISYDNLQPNHDYTLTIRLNDTAGNVLRQREHQPVSTGDSGSGKWDLNELGYQLWPEAVGEGTYYFDVEVYDNYVLIGEHLGATNPSEQFRVTTTPSSEVPEEPGDEEPTEPGDEEPTEPGDEEPTEPGDEEPTEPGDEEPTEPGDEEPTEPGDEEPTEPGDEEPTEPGDEEPTEPGDEEPTVPPAPELPGTGLTPKTETPKTPTTPQNNTPNVPKTGDSSELVLWIAIFALAVASVFGVKAQRQGMWR